MDAGALGVPGDLLTFCVDGDDGVAVLLGPLGVHLGAVGHLDGDSVVRLDLGDGRFGGVTLTGRPEEGRAVEDLDLAVTVTEQDRLPVVADDMTRGVHAVDDVGELRRGGVTVGVVAVGFRPHTGVEELEVGGGGDHGVAAVADRVQPVEALDLVVGDDLEGVGVQGEDAAVVGGEDAGLGGLDGLGFGAGCRTVAAGAAGVTVAVATTGEQEGGGGECCGHGSDRATAGTGGTVHGGISLRKVSGVDGVSTAA